MGFKKVVPTLYKASNLETPFNHWGWNNLGEVAEILGTTPSQVLKRYGALSKDAQYGAIAISSGAEAQNASVKKIAQTCQDFEKAGKPEVAGAIFVPSGWVQEVLKAWTAGWHAYSLRCHHICTDPDEDGNTPEFSNDLGYQVMAHNTGFHDEFYVAVGIKIPAKTN
jgi:hypothetical protein